MKWVLRVVLLAFVAAVLSPIAMRAQQADADVPVWEVVTVGGYAVAACGSSCVDGYLDVRVRDTLTDGSCVDVWTTPLWAGQWWPIIHWCSNANGYFRIPVSTFWGYAEVTVCRSAYGNCAPAVWTQP